ncbi:MAG: hypothetical protein AAF327_01090 [Cyanobacteria bacterium P01_A01_bin.37]
MHRNRLSVQRLVTLIAHPTDTDNKSGREQPFGAYFWGAIALSIGSSRCPRWLIALRAIYRKPGKT